MTRLHPDDIQAIAERVVLLMRHSTAPALPQGISASSARLISMARMNPEAAKAEAKRINREDSDMRRRAKHESM